METGLHTLRPAKGATKARKRIGRGPASGSGKTSGRGQKGQKSRSGSHMMRAGFEGGQMPLYMRVSKLRGSTKKMSMPMGPFRTRTQPVNVEQLGVFDANTDVTPDMLRERKIIRHMRHPIKILGRGELTVALNVTANFFSASAAEKIRAAGGSVTEIERPKHRRRGVKANVEGKSSTRVEDRAPVAADESNES